MGIEIGQRRPGTYASRVWREVAILALAAPCIFATAVLVMPESGGAAVEARSWDPRPAAAIEMLGEARTAEDYLAIVRRFDLGKFLKVSGYDEAQRFSDLEPSIDEIYLFRRLVYDADLDLKILEISAPKIGRAADFLKMATLFGPDGPSGVKKSKSTTDYTRRLRRWMARDADLFMALHPSLEMIKAYRLRMFDAKGDAVLLSAALAQPRSAKDVIALITQFGRRPSSPPTLYDRAIMVVLKKNIDGFLALAPTAGEIQAYRERMANPEGDLALVDKALERVATLSAFQALIAWRSSLKTHEYEAKWTALLLRHFKKYHSLLANSGAAEAAEAHGATGVSGTVGAAGAAEAVGVSGTAVEP